MRLVSTDLQATKSRDSQAPSRIDVPGSVWSSLGEPPVLAARLKAGRTKTCAAFWVLSMSGQLTGHMVV